MEMDNIDVEMAGVLVCSFLLWKIADIGNPCWLESGFVWFIVTLKKKMYKYQFGQYAWTHMILIVVFTQSAFTVANIFEGIFWWVTTSGKGKLNLSDPFIYSKACKDACQSQICMLSPKCYYAYPWALHFSYI